MRASIEFRTSEDYDGWVAMSEPDGLYLRVHPEIMSASVTIVGPCQRSHAEIEAAVSEKLMESYLLAWVQVPTPSPEISPRDMWLRGFLTLAFFPEGTPTEKIADVYMTYQQRRHPSDVVRETEKTR